MPSTWPEWAAFAVIMTALAGLAAWVVRAWRHAAMDKGEVLRYIRSAAEYVVAFRERVDALQRGGFLVEDPPPIPLIDLHRNPMPPAQQIGFLLADTTATTDYIQLRREYAISGEPWLAPPAVDEFPELERSLRVLAHRCVGWWFPFLRISKADVEDALAPIVES